MPVSCERAARSRREVRVLILLGSLTMAVAGGVSWERMAVEDDSIRPGSGLLARYDNAGRAHVVWTASRQVGIRTPQKPGREWHSERHHTERVDGAWRPTLSMPAFTMDQRLLATPDGGLLVVGFGANNGARTDRFGTPVGRGTVMGTAWSAGGGWAAPRKLISDSPKLFLGADAVADEHGMHLAWTTHTLEWPRHHIAQITVDGLVSEVVRQTSTVRVGPPTLSLGRDGVQLLTTITRSGIGPYAAVVPRHAYQAGTLVRGTLVGSSRPGDVRAVWEAYVDRKDVVLHTLIGDQVFGIRGGRRAPHSQLTLSLAGNWISLVHSGRTQLFRYDGEGGWQDARLPALPDRLRPELMAFDVHDGRAVLVVSGRVGAVTEVWGWEGPAEEIDWYSSPYRGLGEQTWKDPDAAGGRR